MGNPPTGNFVALEEAFEEPKEQRRVLRLAEQGKLKVRLQEKLAALPIPEAAEAAWEEVEREFGFEPNPNAKTAFASTLPVPDDHPLTWLLVPPERCGELADTGTTTVRNLPFAEDPEQLAVFSEPKTIRLQDLWIDRTEAEKLLPELPKSSAKHTPPQRRSPITAFIDMQIQEGVTVWQNAWRVLRSHAAQSKGLALIPLGGMSASFQNSNVFTSKGREEAVEYHTDGGHSPKKISRESFRKLYSKEMKKLRS